MEKQLLNNSEISKYFHTQIMYICSYIFRYINYLGEKELYWKKIQ
jgi:hypothetical protein